MNARSYGLDVVEIEPGGASAIADLKQAIAYAKASERSTFIHINSDPLVYRPRRRRLVGRAGGRGIHLESTAGHAPNTKSRRPPSAPPCSADTTHGEHP